MYQQSREPQYDEAAALGILQLLDKNELQRLLDEDDKLQELISDVQQVKNLSGEKEMVIANNKSVAEYNLGLEPKLVQAKEQLAYSYEESVQYQKAYEEAKEKLDCQGAQVSLDTSHALLQTEVAKLEEESEDMTETFLNGDMEESEFVSGYVKKRTQTHTLKVKSEKMGDLIREKQRGGGQTSHPQVSMAPSLTASQAHAAHRPPPPNYPGYSSTPTVPQSGPLPYPVPASTGGGWGMHTPYPSQPVGMPTPNPYYPR